MVHVARTRVKICGLTREEDARLAIELGADALGFIFEPTSKRFLTEPPAWLPRLAPYVAKVAVFGNAPGPFVEQTFQAVQAPASAFGPANEAYWRIGVVHCRPDTTVEDIREHGSNCDALLLDTYKEGAYGGTGEAFDWNLAASAVQALTLPIVLAGGLTPDNVAEAIGRVHPYAVDVSSGVESEPGIKDEGKLKAFFEAVRGSH